MTSMIFSCSKGDDSIVEKTEALKLFEKNFKNESQNLNYNYIQKSKKVKLKTNSDSSIDFTTIPIIENQVVTGRFFEYSDGDAFYIDFSDYTKKIIIYDLANPSEFEIVEMIYNKDSNSYVPNYLGSNKTFMCKVACTIGAMAIAASDGPSPIMDILAVAYQISCVADCG